MMGSVSQAAGHNPSVGFHHIEKFSIRFPPRLFFPPQFDEPSSAAFRVSFDDFQARFQSRKRWSRDVNRQHGAKPKVFAYALMNHLFANTASARVLRIGAKWKIFVAKFAPDA